MSSHERPWPWRARAAPASVASPDLNGDTHRGRRACASESLSARVRGREIRTRTRLACLSLYFFLCRRPRRKYCPPPCRLWRELGARCPHPPCPRLLSPPLSIG